MDNIADQLGLRLKDIRKTIRKHPAKKYSQRALKDITSIAIHHSMTDGGSAEAFANHHVGTNNWPGIGYTYVILKDGTIQWCNDLTTTSYHVGDSNRQALGICLVGDFRKATGSKRPTKEQMESLYILLDFLFGYLPNLKQIKGHQEYPNYYWKECPGFDMNIFRSDYEKWRNPIMQNAVEEKQESKSQEISPWAVDAQKFVVDTKISDGTKPKDPVTREEVWTMLYRYHMIQKGAK